LQDQKFILVKVKRDILALKGLARAQLYGTVFAV
jgi:hypothetical protein